MVCPAKDLIALPGDVALGHVLILFLALLGLRLLHRYTASRFMHCRVHCPTELAAKGQYEAPPRGWTVPYLIGRAAWTNALPELGAPRLAGDGYGQAAFLGLFQSVVCGAIQCEAIRIAREQKSVSLEKRAEATTAATRRVLLGHSSVLPDRAVRIHLVAMGE